MIVTVSEEGFSTKPTSEITKINYRRKDVGLNDISAYIQHGHVLSANFTEDDKAAIRQFQRTYKNFHSTSFVMFDLDDDVEITLDVLLNNLKFKPSIAYETYSHQSVGKGNRYRLLYMFEEEITDIDVFRIIYDNIVNTFDFKINDSCGRNPTQAVFGTSTDKRVINLNKTYSLEDFDVKANSHPNAIIKKEENIIESGCLIQDKEYIDDFNTLSYEDLLEKYRDKYYIFNHTPLPIVDADTPFIILPKDYLEIKRYWILDKYVDEHGNEHKTSIAKRIKDGEQRRKMLFLNAILRRKMIPSITFEHLLNCLVYELYHYIDNRKDTITKRDLFNITKNAFDINITKYDNYGKDEHPYFIVNDEYCMKNNLTKRQVVNMSRRLITYQRIGELYDCNMTDKQNVEEFKKYGLSISTKTLQRFRKECGITKYNRNRHLNAIIKKEENIIETGCPIEIKVDNSKMYAYQCQLILDELEGFLNEGFYDIHDRKSIQGMGRYFIKRAKNEVYSGYSNDELISMLKERFLPILSA